MNTEAASIWNVPANGGDESAVLIKVSTSSVKVLVVGCDLNLAFGKIGVCLCNGAQIIDIPDAPVHLSGVQRESEEHASLLRALRERRFPIFLFNEMDVGLARTYAKLSEEGADKALGYIGNEAELYTGPFSREASHALDSFCNSISGSNIYLDVPSIDT